MAIIGVMVWFFFLIGKPIHTWYPIIPFSIAGIALLYMLGWFPVKRRESKLKSCLEKIRNRKDAIRKMGADNYEALFVTTAGDKESTAMLREVVITCVSNLPPKDAALWAGDAGFNLYIKEANTKTWETAMAWLSEREACLKRQMKQFHVPE